MGDPEGGNGILPLMGVVPDMKADSNRYILIQNWWATLRFVKILMVAIDVNSRRI